ncbi:toprim domain-containing protein [Candidatus Bathyarchaeota archaeon]|nr:MAG: toprim domain-containing protein [Candidatus Bathyarchaeota archaeon]
MLKWTLERVELLMEALDELFKEWRDGACIVVEGKRDRDVLEDLGLKTGVVAFKTLNCCISDAIERLCYEDKVVILTDFDREGEELASRISDVLTRRGVDVNLEVRRKLSYILKGEVKGFEDLSSLLDRLSAKFKMSLTSFVTGYMERLGENP